MPTLLLVVFLVELAVHLFNTIGAASINNLLWTLYLMLPTETSKTAVKRRNVQSEFLRIRRDLNATSSQDEFAKWAKLRRQHDKLQEQLEKMKSSHDATKAKFDSTVGALRWTLTRGLKIALPFWYSKQPMFWLPKAWFPYYVEWVLSFPRAPLGSVSIVSWQMACSVVIMLISDTVTSILGLILGARMQQQKREQPMGAQTAGGEKTQSGKTKKDS